MEVVPPAGLEPARSKSTGPQPAAYTNSATGATPSKRLGILRRRWPGVKTTTRLGRDAPDRGWLAPATDRRAGSLSAGGDRISDHGRGMRDAQVVVHGQRVPARRQCKRVERRLVPMGDVRAVSEHADGFAEVAARGLR